MPDIYVYSGGSHTSPFSTWATAATSLARGIDLSSTASYSSASINIYAHQEIETVPATQNYTLTDGNRVLGTNDTTNAIPTTTGIRTLNGTAVGNLGFNWRGVGFIGGISHRAGTGTCQISFGDSALDHLKAENCVFDFGSSNVGTLLIGRNNIEPTARVDTNNCKMRWSSNIGCGIALQGSWNSINDIFSTSSLANPTTLFKICGTSPQANIYGGDLSECTTTIFASSPLGLLQGYLINCKINSAVTVWNPANEPAGDVYLFDTWSDDSQYQFAHYNVHGQTMLSNTIYLDADPKATYDGTNIVSWVVSGNSASDVGDPYISPWINVYNSTLTALTPRLELIRNDTSTAYNNAALWPEFGYKGTSSSTIATIYSGRTNMLDGASTWANSALGASDWVGESSTAWFGKLEPTTTLTVAEIGHLRARINVTSGVTVYVDPQIRNI
jgi:hypothetical protein